MKIALRVMALTSAILVLSPVAYAAGQNAGPGNEGSGPGNGGGKPWLACREDAQTFCKGIQPGGGRIKDCLEDHYKELSDACYAALKNGPPGPPHGGGGPQGGPPGGGPGNGSNNGPPPHEGMQGGDSQGGPPDGGSGNPPPHDDPGPPPDDR